MCIFTHDAVVTNTRILVAPLPNERQVTIYENTAETQEPNAMILPVPQGNVKLFDVSKLFPGSSLWDQVEAYFPQERSNNFGGGGGFSFGSASVHSEPLPVEQVGGYDCSVAPSWQDLSRIDKSVFTLPDNVAAILKKHYETGFSFIVCKFRNKRVSGHPIGYVSNRLSPRELFIPTRHEHGEEKPDTSLYAEQVMKNADAVHHGIVCDACKTSPIVGTRYSCFYKHALPPHNYLSPMACMRESYDLCSACYQIPENTEHRTHPFVEYRRPDQWYAAHLKEYLKKHTKEGLLFNHTLYVFNAVLGAGTDRYTQLTEGRLHAASSLTFGHSQESSFRAPLQATLEHDILEKQNITRCQKITIKGDVENSDYVACCI